MNVPNLTALRAFEAAARLGSFKAAADELHLTPAAISRSVARLEEELGVSLFDRMHRAVSLTTVGAQYAQRVSDGFRCLATEEAETSARQPRVVLTVEATFLRQWLLPRLRDPSFKELGVSLTVRAHHDPPRTIPSQAELAIVWGYANYSGLKRIRLVSPKTILVAAAELGVTELSQASRSGLIHESNDHWWRLVYAEAGLDYPDAAPGLTLTRCDLPIEAARLGLGTAVGDDVIAEQELRSGTLVPVRGPRLETQDYFLLTRRTPTGPGKAFTQWLLKEAERFGAWQRDFDGDVFDGTRSNTGNAAREVSA
ncbi:MAG: LysR family transcriptional regulator [Pseudomonadota bacterium]